MKPDLIIHRPDIETIVKVPQRRYWFAIYDGGRPSAIDIRPYLLGSAVRKGMLLRYARWLLTTVPGARYVEITADAPPGVARPILALAWIPRTPYGAHVVTQTHVTQEGLA